MIEDLFAAGWDGELNQIKEKFGGLRFYIGSGTDEQFTLIDEAESKSYTICEDCGNPGEIMNNGRGWLRCLCPDHAPKSE